LHPPYIIWDDKYGLQYKSSVSETRHAISKTIKRDQSLPAIRLPSWGLDGSIKAFQSNATGNHCFITFQDKVQSSADHASLTLVRF
jgi:hypothetical protein